MRNTKITPLYERLAVAEKRATELEKLICKIYEDNALGKLPDTRYAALDAQYAKEQGELEKAISGFEQSQKSASKFIALIEKYENFDTMTNTMLNEFVEKILIHERDRKGSQDTTQEVNPLWLNLKPQSHCDTNRNTVINISLFLLTYCQ